MKLLRIIEIANKLQITPDELMQLFFGIGIMVMNQTVEYLDKELKAKLRELFPVVLKNMTDDDYKDLLNILKDFIK